MKKQFLFLFLICVVLSHAQLNKLDTKGKKEGKWVRYLDKLWNTVEDSTKAVYFRYTYYDHGTDIYPMGTGGANKLWKMRTTVDTSSQKGIKILNGDYRWHDPKGRLIYWYLFKDGENISLKTFYETGEQSAFYDFTKHTDGQNRSWHITTYDKKGIITSENYIKKDTKGKWPMLEGQ